MTCSVKDCTRAVEIPMRGWCHRHYRRWRRTGAPDGSVARPSFEERLMAKIDKHGPVPDIRPDLGPCWLWLAYLSPSGYGVIWRNNRLVPAHRATYELLVGPHPAGLVPDHFCRVRHCVNPDHLEMVTNAVNVLRGVGACAQNKRKTHCVNGHEFTSENTIWRKGGHRACRACARIQSLANSRRFRAKKKAA